jgi:hypothetical protein
VAVLETAAALASTSAVFLRMLDLIQVWFAMIASILSLMSAHVQPLGNPFLNLTPAPTSL